MSISTRTSENPLHAFRPARRYRVIIALVLAALLGTIFGIGLTVVSVVLPRQAELARRLSASDFLKNVSVIGSMKQIAPERVWAGKIELENSTLYHGSLNQVTNKSFHGNMKVSYPEQKPLTRKLVGTFLRELQLSTNATVTNAKDQSYETGREQTNLYLEYDYTTIRGLGSIQVWAIGRGDDLTICVSFTER